jgi:hypothetical protein
MNLIDRGGHRASTCRIERGLYVLRYVTRAEGSLAIGRVTVTEGDLDLVPAPGRAAGTLESPGHAIVIVAPTAGAFVLRVEARQHGTAADATFSLDILDDGTGLEPGAAAAPPAGPGPLVGDRASLPLSILAHVSRRGDITAEAGDWVAGPSDILPIEGLSITTARPDVTVSIRVQTTRTLGQWSRWHRGGEFAGSRQRAEAITALGLSLSGDAATKFIMEAEAIHLGAASRSAEGSELEFFGNDPIVGFRIQLKNAIKDTIPGSTASNAPVANGLRIFRARQ